MVKKHIVSFSGGKDSTAMLLRMIELKMPIDEIVFADTGLEFPELYEYIKKVEKFIGRKIKILKSKYTWDSRFYGIVTRGHTKGRMRGFPKTHIVDWCNRDLKMWQLNKFCKGHIIYLGIASDEKHRVQLDNGRKLKYPLIEWGWTEQRCIHYLKEKNLLNPLYSKFKRLGCWLCPKQNLRALRILLEDYPKLWEKLKQYEKDSPISFRPNFKLQDFEDKWKYQTRLNTTNKGA